MNVRNVTGTLGVGIATGVALIAAQSAFAADDRGSVQGVVNDASGKPVVGAMVKLKNEARRLTFMVPTQDHGRFEAKDLPVGNYTVQGVGAGFQSAVSAPVAVTANASAKADVALTAARGAMLPPAWPLPVPEAQAEKTSKDFNALPAGDKKMPVAQSCTPC